MKTRNEEHIKILPDEPSDFVKFINKINNHYSYEFIHMVDDAITTGRYPEGISKKEKKRMDEIIKVYKDTFTDVS